MPAQVIKIIGARQHNLKNLSVEIPREKLVVITGLSGSGKSSLAFDTLYAEGQRRYVESLSAYARQFLQLMDKPDVDVIEGLSPAISIEQKATSHNPRSTVGTVTEIHDYLRLLFARAGTPLRQRLAESFEAALRIADGRALAVEMDEATGAEHLYSSKFACPLCDYSLPELEPRLFSFNSPVGACPTCDGLGVTTVFDAERVVAFPSLSLASGAVKGWDRRNNYTFSLLETVAGHFGFDLDTPFEELPAEARDVLLRGSGDVEMEFVYQAEGARGKPRVVKRKHPFEGILPNLERRLRETD